MSVAGSKVPENATPNGSVQVPPASGVPFSSADKANADALEQVVTVPSVPASGCVIRATETMAWAEQGGEALVTVYV